MRQRIKAERLKRSFSFIKVFDAQYPAVDTCVNNLAILYYCQKRYGEAEKLYFQLLSIRENNFGIEHPEIASSLNNLAELYCSQKRYGEAGSLYQRAVEILKLKLNTNYPSTINTSNRDCQVCNFALMPSNLSLQTYLANLSGNPSEEYANATNCYQTMHRSRATQTLFRASDHGRGKANSLNSNSSKN